MKAQHAKARQSHLVAAPIVGGVTQSGTAEPVRNPATGEMVKAAAKPASVRVKIRALSKLKNQIAKEGEN